MWPVLGGPLKTQPWLNPVSDRLCTLCNNGCALYNSQGLLLASSMRLLPEDLPLATPTCLPAEHVPFV